MDKLRDWLSKRARPYQRKTVTFKRMPEKNFGLPESGVVEVLPGHCPCTHCGHTEMWQCEEADCQCCSSICT
jgi:hypothetical protein